MDLMKYTRLHDNVTALKDWWDKVAFMWELSLREFFFRYAQLY